MNELYFVKAEEIYERLDEIVFKILGEKREVLRTENGKPYIDGNPLFFSLSHSGSRGVIAVADTPVGVDLELYKKRERTAVLSRFCDEERAEILSEKDFLAHWTVREAFVKKQGETLAKTLKSMAYVGGKLFFDGKPLSVKIDIHSFDAGVVAVVRD